MCEERVNNTFTLKSSRESPADDISGGTLTADSDGDNLLGSEPESKVQTEIQIICYRDLDLFRLRNPDGPEWDNLIVSNNANGKGTIICVNDNTASPTPIFIVSSEMSLEYAE